MKFAEGSAGPEQHCHSEKVLFPGVGIPIVQQAANHISCHSEPVTDVTGVGISLVIETALQITCHSEPVTDVTGVGISLVIETAFLLKMEIATPVCELARNDLN